MEPLAPEQLRWLHELSTSQETEAARQEELATAASFRTAFMRQCAADARQRFAAGVRLLPPKYLHVLLDSPDSALREATMAALAEPPAHEDASVESTSGQLP